MRPGGAAMTGSPIRRNNRPSAMQHILTVPNRQQRPARYITHYHCPALTIQPTVATPFFLAAPGSLRHPAGAPMAA